jgi:hypothetical protein
MWKSSGMQDWEADGFFSQHLVFKWVLGQPQLASN